MNEKQTRKDCYIVFNLPEREWAKLREWLDEYDLVEVATGHNNEVWILNETKLKEQHARSEVESPKEEAPVA